MKRPNGTGKVVHAKDGKRRNPYRVMVTVEITIDENGKKKQKQKQLSSHKTATEAYRALDEYNHSKYNLNTLDITFAQVFDQVKISLFHNRSKSTINSYNAAFKTCQQLHNKKIREILPLEMENVIRDCEKGYASKKKIKVLFNAIFKYASKNNMVKKNQALEVDISMHASAPKEKNRLSDEAIALVTDLSKDNEFAQTLPILIYTGLRIGELLALKKSDVDLEKKYFKVIKSKTHNGVRDVPIADKIMPLLEYWYNKDNSEYMFTNSKGKKMSYNYYRNHCWDPIFNNLSVNLTPNVTRHTTISLLAMAEVDERIIRRIVGHSRVGVTDKTYTHIDPYKLHEAINKI